MISIPKYTMGVGDRFGRQGEAQLSAMIAARKDGIEVCPVWNKSFREHAIIHTEPPSVRAEAVAAVAALGWDAPYFVDADHINLNTVDGFIASSDFFTLDVADAIGTSADSGDVDAFLARHRELCAPVAIEGIGAPVTLSEERARAIAEKYLFAVQEAGRIHQRVVDARGAGTFVTEVSMDETPEPQTPDELLVILAAIADEGIPAQTIAPRFSGRFNKGVDYVGEVPAFEREFRADLAVVAHAVKAYGLPQTLKLSVHSGSDKFSIYPCIARAIQAAGTGLHLKTAGTTWLEELIGLAEAGGEGLAIARETYRSALGRFDELCTPYADVIDIDPAKLPEPDAVDAWDGPRFAEAMRHDPSCPHYNPDLRQLLHVGYKVAAEMGSRYLDALEVHREEVAHHVRENLLERHIRAVFP
ncbi:MAG: tagaturonate epimerase family protein [Kiritimatiellia bacterium]|nr:tagaturonate epimerase family protein [Kiritimatiellia bacterium]MDP6629768.1 tagaturonate epimerase family protein [Kiritimatiellia bacterium]MDP6811044.1 tagaturonate epimerase family protein [Kiritimatiellia bacterium]MDP7023101.1 tagaturonate epimerase family protein [Kiritimatiellia bacterium]